MITFIHFLIFTALIFISDASVSFSVARIERRIGSSSSLFRMLFNTTPSYLRRIVLISIIFMAVELIYLNILDNRYFALLPLLIIFLTTARIDSKYYTYGITSAACLLTMIICALTAKTAGVTGRAMLDSPFLIASFVTAMFAISIFDKGRNTGGAMNIAVNLGLNLYVVSVFIPELPYVYSSVIAFGLLYSQFLLHKVYPKFNLFQTMRQSLTIILSASLICFIGNLFWLVFIRGGI